MGRRHEHVLAAGCSLQLGSGIWTGLLREKAIDLRLHVLRFPVSSTCASHLLSNVVRAIEATASFSAS